MAKENVLGHVQGNNQGLLLKDHAHARLVGVQGVIILVAVILTAARGAKVISK